MDELKPDEPQPSNANSPIANPPSAGQAPAPQAPTATPGMASPRCGAKGVERMYFFVPHHDITVGELTCSMELCLFGLAGASVGSPPQLVDQIYDALDEPTKRHWQTVNLPKPEEQSKIVVADQGAMSAVAADLQRLRQQQRHMSEGQKMMEHQRGHKAGRNGGGRFGKK